jgi:hypothetical protein
MKNKFKELILELSVLVKNILEIIQYDFNYYINILLYKIQPYYYLIKKTLGLNVEYNTTYSIDINTTKYSLIKFKQKEITLDNIKNIITDPLFFSKYTGWKYMYIFNNKGQLLSGLSWLIIDKFLISEDITDDDIINYINKINYDLEVHISKNLWWLWLWDSTFYMHISDNDIFDSVDT